MAGVDLLAGLAIGTLAITLFIAGVVHYARKID